MNFSNQLLRVAMFLDGNYFYRVSNYYNYHNENVNSRLGVKALHDFVVEQIKKHSESKSVKIVESNYFRSRVNAKETAENGNFLYYDRAFDDILS